MTFWNNLIYVIKVQNNIYFYDLWKIQLIVFNKDKLINIWKTN